MGKDKKVGDNVFITEIDEGVNVIGKPDVVKNPMTGELERISYIIVTDKKTYCPKCKEENEIGIEITITDKELCIYACRKCNQFVWFRMKHFKDDHQ